MTNSWTPSTARVTANVRGDTDNVTYRFDIFGHGDAGAVIGDNAYVEVRPFPVSWPVKTALLIGKCDMNEARDDALWGMSNWMPIGCYVDQRGWIFPDLLDVNFGASLRLYPVEGLTIGVRVPLASGEDYYDDYYADVAYVFGNTNAYLAYELPSNIGKIRLGWDGNATTHDGGDTYRMWGEASASFDFLMVPNLRIAVGTTIPTIIGENYEGDGNYVELNAYARYRLDIATPLAFHVLFGSKIKEWDEAKNDNNGFGFIVGVGVDWEPMENVPVFIDARYANGVYMVQDSSDGNDCFTFTVGISRRWANAELGLAFECATNGYAPGWSEMMAGYPNHNKGDFEWAVPIKFAYNF